MPIHECRLSVVLSRLENATHLGKVLFYPEAMAYERDPSAVRESLLEMVDRTVRELPALELHRRHAAGEPEVREVTVEIPPLRGSKSWRTPISLTFHAVRWAHGDEAVIAYVPILDIEAVARKAEDVDRLLPEHVRFALMRSKATTSLRQLVWLSRCEGIIVETHSLPMEVRTPKQTAIERDAASTKSVLPEIATQMPTAQGRDVFGMDDTVDRLHEWLSGRHPRSVLLVGPSGVGKTAAVTKLAGQKAKWRGTGRGPLWSTSGSRLVAGMTGYGMWQERCQQLCREAAQTKAVIHLGNLVELMQVGQSVANEQGVGDFLRSYIARGEVLAIAECTAEQLTLIERSSPNMLEAFARLEVKEPSSEEAMKILKEASRTYSSITGRSIDETAIAALNRLHRRYATYSAYPGRPLRFLKNILEDGPTEKQISSTDVVQAFSRETGLPLLVLEDHVRLELPAVREWFLQRVLGQPRAVDVIVDLLATAKAGLARPEKPLASLLFIGPTGVGKTEMAKSLAEFLYQDRQRTTRIDMSEYADPLAIERLIGTAQGKEGLLTAKVREQPFAVVLLDEFEKAHPLFFDLLLQVLGDGRLTDTAGRLADFRNSVIIMTSNLGAETFGRHALGFTGASGISDQVEDHFVREVQRFVRPELFNRIDRIVTFYPLEHSTVDRIARRELEQLRQRDGIRYRNLQVDFSSDLADQIVRRGYDPRYGARPIKRAVEQHVLAPLAAALNEYSDDVPLRSEMKSEGGRIRAVVRSGGHDTGCNDRGATWGEPTLQAAATRCTQFRRSATEVQKSHVLEEMHNELYRLQRIERTRRRFLERKRFSEDEERAAKIRLLEDLVNRTDSIVSRASDCEESFLCHCYSGQPADLRRVTDELDAQAEDLRVLTLDLYAQQSDRPEHIILVAYGEEAWWTCRLARAYYDLAMTRNCQVIAYSVQRRKEERPALGHEFPLGDQNSKNAKERAQANETNLRACRIDDLREHFAGPPEDMIGIALCVRGRHTWPLLQTEEGLHVWQRGDEKCRGLVHTSSGEMIEYQPPLRIDRKDGIGNQEVRRVYDKLRETIDDKQTGRQERFREEDLGRSILGLASDYLLARAKAWLQ